VRRSVTPGSGKFDNRGWLAGLQAQDAARRRALDVRLSGKPAPVTPQERLQAAIVELRAALAATQGGDDNA